MSRGDVWGLPIWVLAFLASTAFLSASPAHADPVDVPAWEFGEPCPDVLVMGARGSGQENGEGGVEPDSPTLGLGSEVYGFTAHLAGLLGAGGQSVGAHVIDYPAVPTADAIFEEPDYFESVEAGKVYVRVALAAIASQCGAATGVVLAGYSQGAAVAREGASFAREEDRQLVTALVLLADPNHDPDGGGYQMGSADPERGGLLARTQPPGWIRGRTVHVCLALDTFCQSELGAEGFLVHGNGYRDPVVQAAAAARTAPLARSNSDTTCLGAQATLVGTAGNDVLIGAEGDDIVVGGGGEDVIRAGDGGDLICPGLADGVPSTADGLDDIRGEGGEDYVNASEGPAVIDGGADDDYLEGGGADDTLAAGTGDDFLVGGPGDDELEAGATGGFLEGIPDDSLIGHGDYFEAGEGDDQLLGGPGEEYLDAGPGDDVLRGGVGEDYLDAGDDDDQLIGGAGIDHFEADAGDDRLDGVDRRPDQFFDCGPGEDAVTVDLDEDSGVFQQDCEQSTGRYLSDTNGDGLVRVAVLGDSYISGVGAVDPGEPYDTGTDTSGNRCRRTSHSWGPQLAALLGAAGDDLLFAACNGATSLDVVSRGQEEHSDHGVHGSQPQVETLRDFAGIAPADIVVLGIGGNDVGFGGLVSDCLMGPCLWFAEQRLADSAIAERYRLADTYRSVLAVAREENENAELWVSTYPNALAATVCGELGYFPGFGRVNGSGIDVAEQVFLRDTFLASLNESIRWAADAAGAEVVDLEDLAIGHELCSADPYFNGVSPGFQGDGPWVVSSRTAHPNKEGHASFASALWGGYAQRFGVGPPEPTGGTGTPMSLSGSLKLGPDPIALQDTAPADVLFHPGDQVHLKVSNAPAGNFRLVVRSLPVVLAELVVPPSGELVASFEVPAWLAPSSHWLTVETAAGEPFLGTILQVGSPHGCDPGDDEADADGDGLPDRCDEEPLDGPEADSDGDGAENAADNCPVLANPGQADADADGLGDACDPSQGGDPTAGYRILDPGPKPDPDPGPDPQPQPVSSLPGPGPAAGGGAAPNSVTAVKKKRKCKPRRRHRGGKPAIRGCPKKKGSGKKGSKRGPRGSS